MSELFDLTHVENTFAEALEWSAAQRWKGSYTRREMRKMVFHKAREVLTSDWEEDRCLHPTDGHFRDPPPARNPYDGSISLESPPYGSVAAHVVRQLEAYVPLSAACRYVHVWNPHRSSLVIFWALNGLDLSTLFLYLIANDLCFPDVVFADVFVPSGIPRERISALLRGERVQELAEAFVADVLENGTVARLWALGGAEYGQWYLEMGGTLDGHHGGADGVELSLRTGLIWTPPDSCVLVPTSPTLEGLRTEWPPYSWEHEGWEML